MDAIQVSCGWKHTAAISGEILFRGIFKFTKPFFFLFIAYCINGCMTLSMNFNNNLTIYYVIFTIIYDILNAYQWFLLFSMTIVECVLSGGNIYTWGWGGANGTFFEDGHSSGGQLVSFNFLL